MTDYKNITILTIPYLTFCAVLYHIAYWGTFNLNGLSYISVSDILKSSISPIIYTMAFVFLGVFLGGYFGNDPLIKEQIEQPSTKNKNKLGVLLDIGLIVIWFFLMFFILSLDFEYKWFIWAIIASFPLSIIFDDDKILNGVIADRNQRKSATLFIILLPFLSFSTGKYQSEQIQNNSKYRYSIRRNINPVNNQILTDTVKYLGNTERNFIFTDLKNTTIFIIKSDNIDTLVLMDKK